MNEILKCIKERRSIRKFQEKQVKDEDISMILEAGTHAPSGNNKQSWHFCVIQEKDKLNKLNELVKLYMGRQDMQDYIFYYNAPTFIIVSNDRENTNGLADVACAMENMALVAHSIGLGSCWINQLKPCSDEPEIRELLSEFGVPKTHIAWASFSLGYIHPDYETKIPNRAENTIHYYKG